MEGEKLWYVVNAYSGHEQKVKENLESRTETMGMENNIFRVVVPEKVEVEEPEALSIEDIENRFKLLKQDLQKQLDKNEEIVYEENNKKGKK